MTYLNTPKCIYKALIYKNVYFQSKNYLKQIRISRESYNTNVMQMKVKSKIWTT